MNSFSSKESLKKHEEYCGQHENVKIELPVENPNLEFQNFNRSLMVPFMVYADFECIVKPIRTCEPNSGKSYPIEYQRHKPISFCYLIKCFDETVFPQKKVEYTAKSEEEDVAQKFVKYLERDIRKIHKRFRKAANQLYSPEEKKDFRNSKECWICKKEFPGDKIRDHCHYTGKYRGAAHQECRKKPNLTPIVFHNLSGYDSHLFIKNLGFNEGNINCIPNNEEKYISFTKSIIVGSFPGKDGKIVNLTHQLRFIDSFKFMAASLDSLVKNMEEKDFKITKSEFEGHKIQPKLEGFNNQKITLRE